MYSDMDMSLEEIKILFPISTHNHLEQLYRNHDISASDQIFVWIDHQISTSFSFKEMLKIYNLIGFEHDYYPFIRNDVSFMFTLLFSQYNPFVISLVIYSKENKFFDKLSDEEYNRYKSDWRNIFDLIQNNHILRIDLKLFDDFKKNMDWDIKLEYANDKRKAKKRDELVLFFQKFYKYMFLSREGNGYYYYPGSSKQFWYLIKNGLEVDDEFFDLILGGKTNLQYDFEEFVNPILNSLTKKGIVLDHYFEKITKTKKQKHAIKQFLEKIDERQGLKVRLRLGK